MLGDAIDSVIAAYEEQEFAQTALMAISRMAAEPAEAQLPVVDVYSDDGIWAVLDDACNNNCHSIKWMSNASEKLRRQGYGVPWIHQRSRVFKGIGGSEIPCLGKRALPYAIRLKNSGMYIPGIIESHEMAGEHALLLSNTAQAKLGMIKDMRSATCRLKDYDDDLALARMRGSGLLVVNIGRLYECRDDLPPEVAKFRLDQDAEVIQREKKRIRNRLLWRERLMLTSKRPPRNRSKKSRHRKQNRHPKIESSQS
jgi:hypothetical protein